MRSEFLPFALPDLGSEEIEEVVDTLRSGWLSVGPKTKRFETDFGQLLGCKHALAVNSATAALFLSLKALGIGPGDEVITTPYTFASTAEVVIHLGARPVFADVEDDTLNLDPAEIAKRITKHTRAIIPVHLAGHPCRMDEITALAKKYNLAVVEDAAHAFPSLYKGQLIGTIGDTTCFSFYATKTITTGEGGMVTTNNSELADKIRVLSLHGISKDAWKRYLVPGSWYYEILLPGYKFNMTDIQASLGIHQLKKAYKFKEIRRRYALKYDEAFSEFPELKIPACEPYADHAWHLYLLRLNLDYLSISRDDFIKELMAQNIGASVHFIPLHLHPYYKETFGYHRADFPKAEAAYDSILSLPIYTRMTDNDVSDVIKAVSETISRFSRRR